MSVGWQLDDQAVTVLRAAVQAGNREVIESLERAVFAAGSLAVSAKLSPLERRLGDRVLWAMELALDQDDLAVAEPLGRAFEAAMTRFGGPNAVENRDVPAAMAGIYERLERLRHQKLRSGEGDQQ